MPPTSPQTRRLDLPHLDGRRLWGHTQGHGDLHSHIQHTPSTPSPMHMCRGMLSQPHRPLVTEDAIRTTR